MSNNTILFVCAAFLAGTVFSAPSVKIDYNKENAHYTVGEEATFKVTIVESNGSPLTNGNVKAKLDNYGPKVITPEREFDLSKGNPFTISGKLDQPGFLRIEISSAKTNYPPIGRHIEGVAYESGRLLPPVKCPDDFEKFWREAIAKYDADITAQPECRLDEGLSDKSWEVWRVSVDVPCERKLYGYLTKPRGSEGRLPTRVQFAAAGYGAFSQKPVMTRGHITLFITVYPFEPDVRLLKKREADAVSANARKRWGVRSYCHGGISESREAFFFYPVILGGNRLVDWLATRDDVDPSHITYYGASQGGGLGLALVALNDKFSKAAVFVPALTGFFGYKAGYESGWPQLIEAQTKDGKAEAEKNAPYFDGANFATLIKIPARVAVGYADVICPPPNVWTAYNVMPSKDKDIKPCLRASHLLSGGIYATWNKWLDE